VEYIDQVHPSRTTWAATPIVKLLKAAEADSRRADGMTLLSAAGHYIRSHAPEHSHQEYGFKTLKQILDASQLFEVSTDDDGATILFKSRAPTA
jgi:OST-HTH/LOTUS domain